ncbi:MAG: hypothetical protein ACRDS9_08725 [Pseudonocardiaceae bacterium]
MPQALFSHTDRPVGHRLQADYLTAGMIAPDQHQTRLRLHREQTID